jgi:predicted dehydrogenase
MALRVGLVGCGWIGKQHADALKGVPGAELAAACDADESRAAKVVEETGANAYSDLAEMLAREELDAVFICTPPHVHGDIELACAGKVRGCLVEKPVANGLDTAKRVRDAFEKSGILAAAGYMNRYRKGVARAKKILSGPGGPPVTLEGRWVCDMPPVAWWRRKSLSGGQMVEQCTHVVDLARFLAGEIEEVFACAASGFITGVENRTVDDAVVATVKFASGAVGSFTTGCFMKPGGDYDPGIGLTVSSPGHRCEFRGWGMALTATEIGGGQETVPAEGDILEIQAREFLGALETGEASRVLSPYGDAVRTLAATLAMNESLETGRPVKVGPV